MRLLLIRHAIAEPRAAEGGTQPDDALRALTAKGRRRMHGAAEGLLRACDPPDLLATSPLVRATDTAAIIAEVSGKLTPVSVPELRPGAGADAVLAWLRKLPPDHLVAAVGHEPDLGLTASVLLGARREPFLTFKKGGAALLSIPPGIVAGTATLEWLLTPRHLRSFGRP
jgi:phosphohistidine phosphatase